MMPNTKKDNVVSLEKYRTAKRNERSSESNRNLEDPNMLMRLWAAGALAIGLSAGIVGGINALQSNDQPATPTVPEAEIPTSGTVDVIPEAGDGYRSLVASEAADSGVVLTPEQLDLIVKQAEELNPRSPDSDTPKQPNIGEPMSIPNIVGQLGVDLTPPTTGSTE